MNTIAWLLLVSALLPILAAGVAKAGGSGFDNGNPRGWLARQEGYRARANAAQTNLFENLPFHFAAVLFALHNQADPVVLRNAMAAWIVVRLAYIGCYVADKGGLRSLVWAISLAITAYILFLGL